MHVVWCRKEARTHLSLQLLAELDSRFKLRSKGSTIDSSTFSRVVETDSRNISFSRNTRSFTEPAPDLEGPSVDISFGGALNPHVALGTGKSASTLSLRDSLIGAATKQQQQQQDRGDISLTWSLPVLPSSAGDDSPRVTLGKALPRLGSLDSPRMPQTQGTLGRGETRATGAVGSISASGSEAAAAVGSVEAAPSREASGSVLGTYFGQISLCAWPSFDQQLPGFARTDLLLV